MLMLLPELFYSHSISYKKRKNEENRGKRLGWEIWVEFGKKTA
jgi:hypothetical protein